MTAAGVAALDSAIRIIARTNLIPSFDYLKKYNVETLDYIYEKSRNFDTLNKKLAKAVLDASKNSPVVYCVDGAVSEDVACRIILSKGKDVEVIEGVSKISKAKNLAKIKSETVQSVSAYLVEALKSCNACVVYDVDDYFVAQNVKAVLSDRFGEESDCVFIRDDKPVKIKIYEIDRQKIYDYSCAVVVEVADFLNKQRYDFADLEKIIKLLRAPSGCPWDRVQTCDTIKKNMIEEAYELVDAINRKDDDGVLEETGDVLLQAAFHSVLNEEKGIFNGTDAITGVVKKLIFRHSHIFGNDKANDENGALDVWEKNKEKEKNQKSYSDTVQSVPSNFPACMRAQKVQKRASKCGFDFENYGEAINKLKEECEELVSAVKLGDANCVAAESGDVLFSAVNVCRLVGVDCEEVLCASTDKFVKRFVEMENLIIADGKDINSLGLTEMNEYYDRAKNELKEC